MAMIAFGRGRRGDDRFLAGAVLEDDDSDVDDEDVEDGDGDDNSDVDGDDGDGHGDDDGDGDGGWRLELSPQAVCSIFMTLTSLRCAGVFV